MATKSEYEVICKIVTRAREMDIGSGDALTQMMDVECAHKQFGMRLEDWLNADDHQFAHDFLGIQRHIDRRDHSIGGYFIPRFAQERALLTPENLRYANETEAAFIEDRGKRFGDRANFVHNLGLLLSQTREGVEGCDLNEKDIVTIRFKHGAVRRVNVECDSYTAIVRDVTKHL